MRIHKQRIILTGILLFGAAILFWSFRSKVTARPVLAQVSVSQTNSQGRAVKAVFPQSQIPKVVSPLYDLNGHPLLVVQTKAGPAYQSEIVRLATKTPDVELTADEICTLQAIYSKVFEARADLEVAEAKVTATSKTTNVVDIPAYSAEGEKLRQKLITGVLDALGQEKGDLFLANFQQHLDDANFGWGRYAQEIVVTLESEKSMLEFIHTVRLPSVSPLGYVETTTVSTLKPDDLDRYTKFSKLLPKG